MKFNVLIMFDNSFVKKSMFSQIIFLLSLKLFIKMLYFILFLKWFIIFPKVELKVISPNLLFVLLVVIISSWLLLRLYLVFFACKLLIHSKSSVGLVCILILVAKDNNLYVSLLWNDIKPYAFNSLFISLFDLFTNLNLSNLNKHS